MKINVRNINLIRAKKNLTLTELGKCCDISRSWVSNIMARGETTPNMVYKLAKGLGVSIDEILEDKEV